MSRCAEGLLNWWVPDNWGVVIFVFHNYVTGNVMTARFLLTLNKNKQILYSQAFFSSKQDILKLLPLGSKAYAYMKDHVFG